MTPTAAELDWVGTVTAELADDMSGLTGGLVSLSHAIHAQPELRFEEHEAAAALCAYLGQQGFDVTSGLGGMDTAFRAEQRFGQGGPTIGVFCEYDALEGLGHACGHNIIAAAGAGAGTAAARWLAGRAGVNGRVVVIGSPGEEGGGGKVRLLDGGVLDDVDAAVMVHPAATDAVFRPNLGRLSLEVAFTGHAVHAASAPDQGVNALDAATLLLVSLGLLRQQIRDGSRIHAIVLQGGEAPNIIPERSRLKVFVRSPDLHYLRGRLERAVRDAAAGAALATGTTVEVAEVAPAYEPMLANPILASVADLAFAAVGRAAEPARPGGASGGSTDMGNVSQQLPSLHPYIGIAPGVAGHTRDFAAAAVSPAGDRAVGDAATILAAIVAGTLAHPDLVERVKEAFRAQTSGR